MAEVNPPFTEHMNPETMKEVAEETFITLLDGEDEGMDSIYVLFFHEN